MANSYTSLSSALPIPKGKEEEAVKLIESLVEHYENGDGDLEWLDVYWSVEDHGTDQPFIWFRHDESANPSAVEIIARELLEHFKLDEPFCCEWACTCSKPRIGEFGGGCFIAKRGMDTVWVDSFREAWRQFHEAEKLSEGEG